MNPPDITHLITKIDTVKDPVTAYHYAVQAEEIAKKTQDKAQIATVHLLHTKILIQNGAYKEALGKNLEAINYFRTANDKKNIAACWKYIAQIYGYLGDKSKQLHYNKNCLKIAQELKDPITEIKILNNIGHTYLELKNYEKAIQFFKANLENKHSTPDLYLVSLKNLGRVYFEKQQYQEAKTAFQEIIKQAKAHQLPIYIIASNYFLGTIYFLEGEPQKALPCLLFATQAIERKRGLKKELLWKYEILIKILSALGDTTSLNSYFDKYVTLSKELNQVAKDQSIKNLQFQFGINEIEQERSLLAKKNKQLQEANAKIDEQRKALIDQAEQLQEVNDELKEFSHRVAHDLKQPIRTISNFAGLLKREVKGQLTNRGDEFIRFITKSTKDITQLVDDLLRYAESDQNQHPPASVNMNALIEQITVSLASQIKETNGQVIYQNLPTIHTHKSLILQVFQNLISNALKFHKPDESPIVKVQGKTSLNCYIFEVIDNGIGIKEAHQQKVFQLFTRLHRKTAYDGSGIGLTTVLKILKRYNATIELDSEIGKGSTFRIILPR